MFEIETDWFEINQEQKTRPTYDKRLAEIWYAMRKRTTNPKNPDYSKYGGRGIKMCKDWEDKYIFFDWSLQNGYKDDLTIDRINNDKGYEPSNCRWITRAENNRNKRPIYTKK